jgi:hypothetical protein
MSPRSYLGKVAIVTSSLMLTSAYIYFRSGGDWFRSSSANVHARQANGLALGGLGNETGQAQLQRIFVPSTKSTAVFTARDVPSGNVQSGNGAPAHERGPNGR